MSSQHVTEILKACGDLDEVDERLYGLSQAAGLLGNYHLAHTLVHICTLVRGASETIRGGLGGMCNEAAADADRASATLLRTILSSGEKHD